jgi:hypothetical protein
MRLLSTGALGLTSALLLAWGCHSNDVMHGTGGGQGGSGGSGGSGASGGSGGSGGVGGVGGNGGTGGTGGDNCGEQQFMLQKGTPDLLIVQDISGSMNWGEDGTLSPGKGNSRWDHLRPAVTNVVTATSAVNWGLMMFPGVGFNAGACDQPNKPDVAVSTTAASTIVSTLNMTTPSGGTPTGTSVTSAAKYLNGLNDGNAKYILLATDGEPDDTCDDIDSSVQAVQTVAKDGVHVFVVGIGTTGINGLNDLADAGLEPNTKGGTTHYYPAASQKDLQDTIAGIASGIASCNFPLDMAPAQPDLVSIEADGATIPKDPTHMNGWDFGPGNTSIVFYGDYCQKLKDNKITNVKAIFACMIS